MAARLYHREELEQKLSSYKCRLVATMAEGFELWETGWGEPFTLYPIGDGLYGDEQFRRVIVLVAATMPQDWNGAA
jgi:hypothetical protein